VSFCNSFAIRHVDFWKNLSKFDIGFDSFRICTCGSLEHPEDLLRRPRMRRRRKSKQKKPKPMGDVAPSGSSKLDSAKSFIYSSQCSCRGLLIEFRSHGISQKPPTPYRNQKPAHRATVSRKGDVGGRFFRTKNETTHVWNRPEAAHGLKAFLTVRETGSL